jgi:hypothetical protein
MALIKLIYTAEELKALDKKHHATLKKRGIQLVRTSPEIRNLIIRHPEVNKKLKALLRPTYNRLKRK